MRLRRGMFAVRRLLMSRVSPLGLTHEQYIILLFLNEQHAATQNKLAQRSYTNPNTVKDILNRLEAEECVLVSGLAIPPPRSPDGRSCRAAGHRGTSRERPAATIAWTVG